ncbi:MAG: DNA adenine methylase [Candidatus Nitrosopolaris sp.]
MAEKREDQIGVDESVYKSKGYCYSNRRDNIVYGGVNLKSQNGENLNDSQIHGYSHLVDLRHCYPFVKWAGGKSQLLSELDSMIPSKFNRYFEPFLGGGAMFFHLVSYRNMRITSYLSDINEELITAYNVVKNNVRELIELLKRHQRQYCINPSEYYYKLRDEIKPVTDIDRTARFVALNKTCFNGLYRVNRNGIFNVPIGRYKNPLICDSNNLEYVSKALRYSEAAIKVNDYRNALLEAEKDDFIYLDPPYHPTSSTANFTGYSDNGFGHDDQLEISKIFVKLDNADCHVLLSNSDTPFIRKLYSDFSSHIKEVNVSRLINCKASRRMGHKELLISNYP